MTEINKYHKSKIYTIKSPKTNLYYIGSTVQPLHKRYYEHKRDYYSFLGGNKKKYVSSIEILKLEDSFIELLEEYKCNNKQELNKREGELIRLYKNNLVNKCISGRNLKEYYIDNKEKMKKYQNEYNNNEKLKEIIKCECGLELQKYSLISHKGSKIHNKIMSIKSCQILP
jgi:hypothetical protein